jgi:DNA-binding LacI/PurR family transcriptional regulator
MQDVADVAGVSHQTVSRVLNGFESIRPETRDRVLAAISQLGYRRNAAARALVTSRTHAIGVLAPAVSDYGPTSAVQAIERSARAVGYHPLVTTTATDRASVLSSLGFLLDQAVEALVVIAPHIRVLDAVRELELSLPIVTLQSTELGSGTGISIDHLEGAQLAMAHLLELGHRRIQHVAGPLEFFEAAARRHGYEAALVEAGLEPLPLFAGDWSAGSGYRAAAAISPDATAVFCGNDQMALGLIHGLADRGLRVPQDVSVVGFDDVPEAEHYLPPLTTVSQDFARIGELAVEVLLAQISGAEKTPVPTIEPVLVVRASTAPPRT